MISIISAIYKSERYLPSFLKHAQKFAGELKEKGIDFEIIIVPTNPSEKEKELLSQAKKQPWCVIHELNRQGLYAAWNEGCSIARGGVIGLWNVDDIRFASAVVEAQELIKKGKEVIYFPFYIKRYLSFGLLSIPVLTRKIEGQVLKFEKRKFETTMTCGPHFMFTKEAYNKVGPFDEQFKIAGDFDWCARAASMNLKFVCAREFSGIFRVDGRGISAGPNRLLQAENNVVFLRRQALEKIRPGLEDLSGKFQIAQILYQGNLINYPK